MARSRIYVEDIAGTALAVVAHVGLVVWLVWAPQPKLPPAPERVSVTLQGEVGEQSSATSREASVSAAAPVLSKDPVPHPAPVPAPVPAPMPIPQPVPKVAPAPAVRMVQPPIPKVQPRPIPAPVAKPPVPPKPRQSRLGADFLPPDTSTPSQRAGGASRFADAFKKGVPGTDSSGKATVPAGPVISAQVKSSLQNEVMRQLKPNWDQPDGVDVEKLETTVEWHLNADGSRADTPRCIGHRGETPANRPQVGRHCEQAIRAVVKTRFNLPSQYYAAWQHIVFTFTWKLN